MEQPAGGAVPVPAPPVAMGAEAFTGSAVHAEAASRELQD
jgi:hypothetical protein